MVTLSVASLVVGLVLIAFGAFCVGARVMFDRCSHDYRRSAQLHRWMYRCEFRQDAPPVSAELLKRDTRLLESLER